MKTKYFEAQPYITKDGSRIRELMHPDIHGNTQLSFAEATIEPGYSTKPHTHTVTEEIYHVALGTGVMHLGEEIFSIEPGDSVCIAPGISHYVENTGKEPLKIFCCCAPPYSHEDTKMCQEMT